MNSRQNAPARLCDDAIDALKTLMAGPRQLPDLTAVADHLNVDREMLVELFRSEHELLIAMAQSAIAKLHDRCVRSVVAVDAQDPIGQFEALADAYIDWALEHPREFDIIASMPSSELEKNQLNVYENALHELMLSMLRRAQLGGRIRADDNLSMLVILARVFAYGVARKMLLGDLFRWRQEADPRQTARTALHTFIRKLIL